MKLSKTQNETLQKIAQPYTNGAHHPIDAYNRRTVEALENKGLVETYHYSRFLNGAVRLSKEGKELINSISL